MPKTQQSSNNGPQQPSVKEAIDKLTGNLVHFGKVVAPSTFSLPSPDIHFDIAELFLDTRKKLLNIIAPRGIAKTTLVIIYVLYHLFIEDRGKRKFVVIISKTQPHAKSILATIKNIIEYSRGFRMLFGYHGEHVSPIWREDRIELDSGDGIDTRGTGQPVRGINLKTQRPTLIVSDDGEDENNTKTEEAMAKNLTWLLNGAVPSIDPIRGRVIVIGTPLHELCTVWRLKKLKTWQTFHYGNSIDEGIALWPEQRPIEWLKAEMEAKSEVGLVHQYYQEYECKLVPGGSATFRKEMLRYYNETPRIVEKHGVRYLTFGESNIYTPVNIYMGIDPASSTRKTADYSTIVPVAVTHNFDVYVLPYFRKRVTPLDLANAIQSFYISWKPNLTTIESTGYQEMLRQYMRTKIFIPGLEQKELPRDSKSARLEMLQPFVAQGKVYLWAGKMLELENEMVMYPRGEHDDLLDALYYALKRARAAANSQMPEEPRALPEHQQVIVRYYEDQEKENDVPLFADVFGDDD